MLQISDGAKTMLKNSLDGNDGGQVYRLVLNEDRLALGLATIEEGDTVYDLDGVPVLAAPTDLAEQFEGTIDVEQTNEGSRLVLAT